MTFSSVKRQKTMTNPKAEAAFERMQIEQAALSVGGLERKVSRLEKENAELAARHAADQRKIAALVEALTKIAYEPFGESDATHAEVLDAITEYARAALEAAKE